MVRMEFLPTKFVICLKTAKIIEHLNILRKLIPYFNDFHLQFPFKYRAINGGGEGGDANCFYFFIFFIFFLFHRLFGFSNYFPYKLNKPRKAKGCYIPDLLEDDQKKMQTNLNDQDS